MKKKKIIKKAQAGATIPQEKDYPDTQSFHEALDAYLSEIGYQQQLSELNPIGKSVKAPSSDEVDYKKVTGKLAYIPQIDLGPSVEDSMKLVGRDMSKPASLRSPKQSPKWGNIAVTALGIADALIPNGEIEEPVVEPLKGYNPRQYGNGSQAIAQKGITISQTGYKSNSKDRNKPKLRIPSNQITMKGVPHPVIGTGSDGQQIVMQPGQDYIFPNAEYVDEQPFAKKGKKIAKPYVSKSYKDGGGIQIENNDYQSISADTLRLTGDSHDNGGQLIQANGRTVEAEGGETIHRDSSGAVIVGGNLRNPLTGKKFKEDFKMIGKKEAKADKLMKYSTDLLKMTNPYDKWDRLKFNAGEAMMKGAKLKGDQLSSLKEHLTDLQEASIALKEGGQEEAKNGLKMHYKDGGKIMKAQRGVTLPDGRTVTYAKWPKEQAKSNPQLAGNQSSIQPFDFYNTPSSQLDPVKYLQAIYSNEGGETGVNPPIKGNASGKYALMPAAQQDVYNAHYKGQMSWDDFKKNYDTDATFEYEVALNLAKDKIAQYPTAAEAIGAWYHPLSVKNKAWDTVPSPEYGNKLSVRGYVDRAAKNYFAGTNKQNPNSIYGGDKTTKNPDLTALPKVVSPQFPAEEKQKGGPNNTIQGNEFNPKIQEYKGIPVESDAEGLQFKQILPEIYAGATNREEPVWLQQYNPQLYQHHTESFQERRNQITSQGRATRQYLQNDANAQAVLAAQEYDALNQVGAEEFRINQGIAEDITNKNISLLNESQLKNLQLADLQYTRQATAKSKTKTVNQDILNSVSNKVLQNQLEQRTLKVYENMYPHYRYDEDYKLDKVGTHGSEYINGLTPVSAVNNTAEKVVFGPNGETKTRTLSTPGAMDRTLKKLQVEDMQNPLLKSMLKGRKSLSNVQRMFKQGGYI